MLSFVFIVLLLWFLFFFFFNDTATTEIYTLSLHDALPILRLLVKDLLNKSPQIVLDLGDVTHMDSGGLGALVALYTSARAAGGVIKTLDPQASLSDLL